MADWHSRVGKTPDDATSNNKEEEPSKPLPFKSRRSPVLSTNGAICSSQPLASSIGLQILCNGGNVADAAIATAAALAVTEPCSTGLGGDMFALHYDANERKVSSINGSGRCPTQLTLQHLKSQFPDGNGGIDAQKFMKSACAVTIPGAARGWEDYYNRHASKNFSFGELLEPAAKLAEEGFPVAPITAHHWAHGVEKDIKRWISDEDVEDGNVPFTNSGDGPEPGEIFRNEEMAAVLRALGKFGATQGFYESFPGEEIVKAVNKHGGIMTFDDFKEESTLSTFPEPIFVEYQGVKLWQVPPNGQGIAGLIALSGIDALEKEGKLEKPFLNENGSWSTETLHAMIEMMRLGFGDARAFVCDTDFSSKEDTKRDEYLLNRERIAKRASDLFNTRQAVVEGLPDPTSCTVSFQVVDKEGNAVSFVNSNFMGFGTGIVPDKCGFSLQNRGFGFSLEYDHPNALAPRKRPYHTIIPGMLTYADTNELYATLSNMGGYMQPQGHMQLTVAMVSEGLDPQTAIDTPRFCIADGTHNGTVFLEDGFDLNVIQTLKEMGHNLEAGLSGYERSLFGKAQIIKKDRENKVLWAGSDGRSDGCAMGY
jgi:gamma-glutamyltranspeptidase/glutathione hydrolase